MRHVKRALVAIVALAVLVGIGVAVAKSAANASAASDARDAFFAALRGGDVDAAYAKLSARRRAAMSRDAFAALTDHPAFRKHSETMLRAPQQKSPGLCSYGKLVVDGATWAAEVFLIEEGGQWHVHSFAIQPPATVQLGVLLEECGYWEGTRAGYSGPAIERATPPLPL